MIDWKRWNRIRWLSVLVYLGIVLALVGLLIALPGIESIVGIVLVAFTMLGLIPLLVILNVPYIKGRYSKPVPNEMIGPPIPPKKGWPKEFQDSVRMDLIPLVIIPVAIISVLPILFSGDLLILLVTVPVLALIGLVAIFFWRLNIHADCTALSFHYGPIGRTIPLEEIVAVRPTSIHALRDYMGYGWRSGSDGSIGYISTGRTGINLQTREGKTYVITCHRPQELADHVKWCKRTIRVRRSRP